MHLVLTSFDYSVSPPRPLVSLICTDIPKFKVLYLPGSGLSIKDILLNIKEVREVLSEPSRVNDFKAHVASFGLDKNTSYEVFDMCLPKFPCKNPKRVLIEVAKVVLAPDFPEPKKWQKLRANASVVYQSIQDKGLFNGYKHIPMNYSLNTFPGRSSTPGFNIQGSTSEFNLRLNRDFTHFVNFDWISADINMAAHMAADEEMINSFVDSDPYAKIAAYLDDPKFDRDECKKQLIRSIYSLDFENAVLEYYPVFQKWLGKRLEFYNENGYLSSIFGRKFIANNKEGDRLTVFNSQFQGSVVHAMQAALIKVFNVFSEYLMTEIHDSIIFNCPANMVDVIVRDVAPIMVNPLYGWMEDPPRMPVRINVGTKWRKWELLRVCR